MCLQIIDEHDEMNMEYRQICNSNSIYSFSETNEVFHHCETIVTTNVVGKIHGGKQLG